jgi:hypothetical protein
MRSPDRATALPGEQETELRLIGLRRARESMPNSHREATATAPVLDSTRHNAQNPKSSWSIWRSPAKLGRWAVGTEYCLCLLSLNLLCPSPGSPTPDAAS